MKVFLFGLMLSLSISVVLPKRFRVKTINRKRGNLRDEKIYDGSYVQDMKKYAYMVSIKIHKSHVCGGGLLKPNFVVTACHCMAKIPEEEDGPAEPYDLLRLAAYNFVAGTANIEKYDDNAQVGKAESVHYHPKCQNAKSLLYDHALAKMRRPFVITPYVSPLKMYTWDKEEFKKLFVKMFVGKGPKCEVSGWGDTRRGINNPELASDRLKSVEMVVLSEEDCSKTWSILNPRTFRGFNFWDHGEICVLNEKGLGSDCAGDSGSPYVCEGHLLATVSFGAEDCSEGDPSVYATVAELIDWISKDFVEIMRTGGRAFQSAESSSTTSISLIPSSPISSPSIELPKTTISAKRSAIDAKPESSVSSNQKSLYLNIPPIFMVFLIGITFEE